MSGTVRFVAIRGLICTSVLILVAFKYLQTFKKPSKVVDYAENNDLRERRAVESRDLSMLNELWKMIKADQMTADDVFKYLHWTNSSACQVAYDFGGKIHHDGRKHGIDGQKTVCVDPKVGPMPPKCTVIHFLIIFIYIILDKIYYYYLDLFIWHQQRMVIR